jgi:hypothetical protein
MTLIKFDDVIDAQRLAGCKTCNTYIYTMPCHIDIDFGDYVLGLGKLNYPLANVKMVRMDNALIKITSRVGRNWLEVKFKKQGEQALQTKQLFDIQIASYVEAKNHITITM